MFKERIRKPLLWELFFYGLTGFDHDGVMADSRQAAVDGYNDEFKTNHTVDEIRNQNSLAEWAKEDLGVSDEKAMRIHNDIWYHRPDILFHAKPRPGAIALTQELTRNGNSFQIVTSRPEKYTESTYQWYRENMPWISKDQINIKTTDEMTGEVFKTWTISPNRLGIDVFFEDSVEQAKYITTYTNAIVVLLSNEPIYDIPNRDRIIKVTSLENRQPTLQEAEQALFYR